MATATPDQVASLKKACAYQLGIERTLKTAGITGPRREIVLEVAGRIASGDVNPQSGDQVLTAVKQAAALYLL